MNITHHEPLGPRTTFRVGGEAACFVVAKNVEDIREAVSYSKVHDLALLVLGGGSNVLVSDEGFTGMVLQVGLTGIEWQDTGAIVAAGEVWDAFVAMCVERGLWGVENLSGIPGSVGGTPIQNVGAYGAEVRDVIIWVEAFDIEQGVLRTFTRDECRFDYRESFFKTEEGKKYIVTRVAFSLSVEPRRNLTYKDLQQHFAGLPEPSLVEIRAAALAIRSRKFPDLSVYGTAGSFFKNPILSGDVFAALQQEFPALPSYPMKDGRVKIPAAWLIERLGWKGRREGDVGTFAQQSIVLVNFGNATASEIQSFARKISDDVFDKTKIKIEAEVRYV